MRFPRENNIQNLSVCIQTLSELVKISLANIDAIVKRQVIVRTLISYMTCQQPFLQDRAIFIIDTIATKAGPDHVDALVAAQVIQKLITLTESNDVSLIRRAVIVLNGIAAIRSCGWEVAAPVLIRRLHNLESFDVVYFATAAIGNIAMHNDDNIKLLIDQGALGYLLEALTCMSRLQNPDLHYYRIATWTMSNLCRMQPPPPVMYETYLPVLAREICHADSDVVYNSCLSMYYLIQNRSHVAIQSVMDADIVDRVVTLLYSNDMSHHGIAMTITSVFMAGNSQQLNRALTATNNVFRKFEYFLFHPNEDLRRNTAVAIRRIIENAPDNLQKILDNDIITGIVNVIRMGDVESQKLGVFIIEKLVAQMTKWQVGEIQCLTEVIDTLTELLPKSNAGETHGDIVDASLESLRNLFQKNKRTDAAFRDTKRKIEKRIQQLQFHNNRCIRESATRVIRHWPLWE